MSIDILMPALSPTMTEGKIARWIKKPGEDVKSGDILCEIETDKATMEVEAADEGKLGKILVPDGSENVPVNTVIGVLLEEGEDAASLGKPAPKTDKPATAAPPPPAPAPAPAASSKPEAKPELAGDRIIASPLARRIAKEKNLDLSRINGSGPHGRIVKQDVESRVAPPAPAAKAPPPSPAPSPAGTPLPFGAAIEIPNSSMRKVIARRLTESKQTVPHFYLTIDCELDALLALRQQINGMGDESKVSVNDFVIRACAVALRKMPAVNASWSEAAIRRYQDVDISVAVATEGGLITPVIRKADTKGLRTISAEMKDLAARARLAKLKMDEYQGGGFSISNLGMYGIRDFAAIINPPQGAILAVGAGEQRPVVRDGALAVATVMCLTLSVDHRVIDGALGAEFMAEVKKLIQNPLAILI